MDRDRDFEEVSTANGIDANGRLGAILQDNLIAGMFKLIEHDIRIIVEDMLLSFWGFGSISCGWT